MSGPPAPSVFVFCDVDETLIRGKSMVDFLEFYLAGRYGAQGGRRAARIQGLLGSMAATGVPRAQANRRYYRAWAGEPADAVDEAGRRWWAERSADADFYLATTRAELRGHRTAGAVLVLVSGSLPALVGPIAADVGAAVALCARPLVRGGRLTGALDGEPMIGEAKGRAVRDLLRRHPSVAPADCYAYGDHESDLPMLAEVGHPVVVGADPRLLGRLPRARALVAV